VPCFESGPGPVHRSTPVRRSTLLEDIVFHPADLLHVPEHVNAEGPLTPVHSRSQTPDLSIMNAITPDVLTVINSLTLKLDILGARFDDVDLKMAEVMGKLELVEKGINATAALVGRIYVKGEAEEEIVEQAFDDYGIKNLLDPQGTLEEVDVVTGENEKDWPRVAQAGRGGGGGGYCGIM
jgi:hypothetical protein